MAEEEKLHGSWENFFLRLETTLSDAIAANPGREKSLAAGAKIANKVSGVEKEEFEMILVEFSYEHRERRFGTSVLVESNDVLFGLQAELDEITEEEPPKENYKAIEIAIESIQDLLTKLPNWVNNSRSIKCVDIRKGYGFTWA